MLRTPLRGPSLFVVALVLDDDAFLVGAVAGVELAAELVALHALQEIGHHPALPDFLCMTQIIIRSMVQSVSMLNATKSARLSLEFLLRSTVLYSTNFSIW